jgi:uncharacterized SAM-binding protein YcdF (DUF218 family)
MNPRICFFGILLILIAVYIGGFLNAGKWLVKADRQVHADAVVILMGTISDRVLQAVDIYNSRTANRLIVVEGPNDGYMELKARGAHMLSGTSQVVSVAIDLGIPGDSIIILSGGAQSTQQEACIIRKYIADKPSMDTLILATSSTHTRRASMIFKNAFNGSVNQIHVYCSPNPYTNFDANKWWKSKDDIETVLMEYIKVANFFLFDKRELKKE